jgi:dUTP pyrophosphatase
MIQPIEDFWRIKAVDTPCNDGEVKIILANLGSKSFTITRGMRIAQLVLAPTVRCGWAEVADLDATARGEGGFGSTGRH